MENTTGALAEIITPGLQYSITPVFENPLASRRSFDMVFQEKS
jgi:hypothetical protein